MEKLNPKIKDFLVFLSSQIFKIKNFSVFFGKSAFLKIKNQKRKTAEHAKIKSEV